MNANRIYTQTLKEAKELYFLKTGHKYDVANNHYTGIKIFTLKKNRGKTEKRKYYVGSYMSYINRN
jgi:hypothetical protein